jgi:hypothetical protein
MESIPKDIRDAADALFGFSSAGESAKREWVAKQMEQRWKQESQERMWRGLGADAAQAITRSR